MVEYFLILLIDYFFQRSIQLDWLVDMISSGKLYDKEAEYVEDSETRAFLAMQVGYSNGGGRPSKTQSEMLEEGSGGSGGGGSSGSGSGGGGEEEKKSSSTTESADNGLRTTNSSNSLTSLTHSMNSDSSSANHPVRQISTGSLRSASSNSTGSNQKNRRTTRFVPAFTPSMNASLKVRAHERMRLRTTTTTTSVTVGTGSSSGGPQNVGGETFHQRQTTGKDTIPSSSMCENYFFLHNYWYYTTTIYCLNMY